MRRTSCAWRLNRSWKMPSKTAGKSSSRTTSNRAHAKRLRAFPWRKTQIKNLPCSGVLESAFTLHSRKNFKNHAGTKKIAKSGERKASSGKNTTARRKVSLRFYVFRLSQNLNAAPAGRALFPSILRLPADFPFDLKRDFSMSGRITQANNGLISGFQFGDHGIGFTRDFFGGGLTFFLVLFHEIKSSNSRFSDKTVRNFLTIR